MKRLRADSTFSRLTAEQLAVVDDMLLAGKGYAEVQQELCKYGQRCSQTSIADYYQRHVAPRKWARQARIATELAALDSGGVEEATLLAVRQAVFELAMTPDSDPKHLRMLYELVLKAQAQQMDARKLALLEAKAAAADAAEAAAKDEGLTVDERVQRIREIFGMAS